MGHSSSAPINESISILSALAPTQLSGLQAEFPHLAAELEPGRIGGEAQEEYALERAQISLSSLRAVTDRASQELVGMQHRIKSSRALRLCAQVLTLICSGGVLASLALDANTVAVVTAVATFLSAIGTLFAEHREALLKPGEGDIYEAFEQASNANFKAGRLASQLELKLRYKQDDDELKTLIAASNELAEQLHGWVVKITGSAAHRAPQPLHPATAPDAGGSRV